MYIELLNSSLIASVVVLMSCNWIENRIKYNKGCFQTVGLGAIRNSQTRLVINKCERWRVEF